MNRATRVCPKCKTRVMPKIDGTCPSCQSKIVGGKSTKQDTPKKVGSSTSAKKLERSIHVAKKKNIKKEKSEWSKADFSAMTPNVIKKKVSEINVLNYRSDKQFGTEVFQGKVFINSASKKAIDLSNAVYQSLKKRNIPNFNVESFSENSAKRIIAKKVIKRGEEATIMIEVKSWGNDLIINVKHYELSTKNTYIKVIISTVAILIGISFWWLGIPLLIGIFGIVYMGSKSRLSSDEQHESNLLKNIVIETLLKSMKTLKLKTSDVTLS